MVSINEVFASRNVALRLVMLGFVVACQHGAGADNNLIVYVALTACNSAVALTLLYYGSSLPQDPLGHTLLRFVATNPLILRSV